MDEYETKLLLINKIIDLTKHSPILNVSERVGYTGYIDYIRFEELSSPIMHGIDCCKRKFIVFKFQIDDDPNIYMQTLFQRYTNNECDWRPCGHATVCLIDACSPLHLSQLLFLTELFSTGSAVITSDDYPYESFENKRVYLRNKPEKLPRFSKSKIWNYYNNSLVSFNTLLGVNKIHDDYQHSQYN